MDRTAHVDDPVALGRRVDLGVEATHTQALDEQRRDDDMPSPPLMVMLVFFFKRRKAQISCPLQLRDKSSHGEHLLNFPQSRPWEARPFSFNRGSSSTLEDISVIEAGWICPMHAITSCVWRSSIRIEYCIRVTRSILENLTMGVTAGSFSPPR